MFKRFNIWLFVAAVMALPISVFAVVNWYERSVQALPILIDKDHRIAAFSLTNQHGTTSTLKDWDHRITVVNFFFTHCPVVCPKMTEGLKQVQEALKNNKHLQFASFSVDPERDTAERLAGYVSRFQIQDRNWLFLTGSKKEIYRLARNSFKVTATDGDGGPDDFIHSDQLILVDQHQRVRGYYEGTIATDIQQLINDIKKLQNEK